MTAGVNHINVKARDQEALRDFLIAALGVRVGPRPAFNWHGYWLYLGDTAVIHTAPRDDADARARGWVDHIAFGPFDFDERVAALEAAGQRYRWVTLPGSTLRQIFVEGPEGIKLELQCPGAAAASHA